MVLALDLLNLNTSRKIMRVLLFTIGFNIFLAFSGVEALFETGQIQNIYSYDIYCLSGEVTAGNKDSGESVIDTLFISPATLETRDGLVGHFRKVFEVKRTRLSPRLVLESLPIIFSPFDRSNPDRAPPKA